MATTKTTFGPSIYSTLDDRFFTELEKALPEKLKEAPKPKNIYEDKYKFACEQITSLQKRLSELNDGLTQRELRIIVNRALKQKGVPVALPLRKYASKTAFVAALSNALFELAQVPDPDKLP